jgi:hypothetical protein
MESTKIVVSKSQGSWLGCGVGRFVGGFGGLLTIIVFPVACLAIPAGVAVATASVLVCNAIGEELGLP